MVTGALSRPALTPRLVPILCVALALGAVDASANSISNEVTVGTGAFPLRRAEGVRPLRSLFVSNALTGSLDLGKTFGVDLSYVLSRSVGTAPTHVLAPAVSWFPREQWLFALTGTAALPTENRLDSCVPLDGRFVCGTLEERLGSFASGLIAAYESAGFEDIEWGVEASADATLYQLDYTLLSTGASRAVAMQQLRLGAGAVLHLYDRLDLSLRGAGYLLASGIDPALLARALSQFAGGLPLAPLRWEVGPAATWFFTRKLYLSTKVRHGVYQYACNGANTLVSATLTGRPGSFQVWGGATLIADVPPRDEATVRACKPNALEPRPDPVSLSVYLSTGVGYTF